ncbi:cbb3-type cytochrome c oxidase N-terminal domain-containing protein [Lentisphaera profundi]|uniref:Cbb3-type cytochrome c oxidase N-terminal domain-containing protein n=1 Tax=Lentisphaera profundi TaxID=1658616 RepID=A0ABY7VUD6_9BACT|nr:cbb3-type cytochrome c oxidase N-terminal domain-containing protein [Lentisphaera profundi]WDE95728.1 cbb3-type cytochrome c oxidase N-terminal domain-containing protein [Lentisphaera profundi]
MTNIPDDDKLMDHDYDGIRELDNDLPTWWLATMIFTIILGGVYVLHYHVFSGGNLMEQAYQRELNNAAQEQQARLADFDSLSPQEQRAQLLLQGQGVFTSKCAICHGPQGQGMVGPNLTDEYFLHGGSLEAIQKIIEVGVADKGMPKWEGQISPREIQGVSQYVYAMKGKKLPGREAQGEKEK